MDQQRYWGIWLLSHGAWMETGDGLYYAPHKAIAEVYLKQCVHSFKVDDCEIREFISEDE